MPEITITYTGSLLRFQNLSIKNARSKEILSKNLEKYDTFHLPAGNHVIEIAFRFNLFQYPPSRFSIDIPEDKHLYFDLKEKVVAHYLIAQFSNFIILVIGATIAFILKRDSFVLIRNLVVTIPILFYYQIKIITLWPKFKLLNNGYLELHHGQEY